MTEDTCPCAFCSGLVEALNGMNAVCDAGVITGWAAMALSFRGLIETGEKEQGENLIKDPETRQTYEAFWSMAEMWIQRMRHTAEVALEKSNENPGGMYN